MNYYIDFDETLYKTTLLKEEMLSCIAKTVCEKNNKIKLIDMFAEAKSLFCKEKIYDIFELGKYIANKYSVDADEILNKVNQIIDNGERFVYDDSVAFLKKLKNEGNNVYLLSYCAQSNTKFQEQKIVGSGLTHYFDKIYITKKPKYEIDIDYKNGIFIDDNPNDIDGLCKHNPIKVIRIKRKYNRYNEVPVNQKQITEIYNLEM